MRDQQRAQTLLDGLKARASAARPVEQQLLWAGRYGLVELFKKPADPAEFERLFTTHMSEAKRLLEGGKAESSPSTMKAASQPLSLPDTVGSSTEVGRPQGDSQK